MTYFPLIYAYSAIIKRVFENRFAFKKRVVQSGRSLGRKNNMDKIKQKSSILLKVREIEKWIGFESDIKWMTTFIVFSYHVIAIVWCYHYMFPVKWQTIVFAILMFIFSGFGITAGAHRYWAHRAFKASTPLRLFLLFGFASTGQATLNFWVRNHRVHHKYSDTDSDPHNSERGLFFSHIGWLMMKRKQSVSSKYKEIDMSDIDNDPLVSWHTKNANIINPLCCFILPTLLGILLWGEDWRVAVAWQCGLRFLFVYHSELSVNSLAHALGTKPYDQGIRPAENLFVSAVTGGEGWHNFHHAFPFDYRAAEWSHTMDLTTNFIHLFERIGWVNDKREVSRDTIKRYIAKKHDAYVQTENID